MMPEFTEFHPMFFCLLDAVQALLPERSVYSPRQGGRRKFAVLPRGIAGSYKRPFIFC